jgi:predicted Zn-dependent protease
VTIGFHEYNRGFDPPSVPDSATPLRDAFFPDAKCIGDQYAECFRVQDAIDSNDECRGDARRICIVPLGQVPVELIHHLADHYRTVYAVDVRVTRPLGIPTDMAEPLRQQVDASRLINYMIGAFPAYANPDAVFIGVTVLDIYNSEQHYRYLLGVKRSYVDPIGVVSTFRMDPAMYGEPKNQELFYSRVRKMTSKYVGMLFFGVPVSQDPTSPMYDSIGGPDDLDAMTEPLPVFLDP